MPQTPGSLPAKRAGSLSATDRPQNNATTARSLLVQPPMPAVMPPIVRAASVQPKVVSSPGSRTIQMQPVPRGQAYGVESAPGEVSLIHRVDPAQGLRRNAVRVYLTVFAFSTSGYKDIHANGLGIKLIHKTADTMFNIGDPRRAFHYYNTYRAQQNPATCPIIRSFDIPAELYDRATGQAISESQRKKLGTNNAYNVDKERGQNQFGVHAKLRDEIEQKGRRLISYVDASYIAEVRRNPANGTVKDVNELRRQLGMPTEVLDFMAPMRGAHFVSPREEAAHGADLTRLYDDLDALIRATSLLIRSAAKKRLADRCVKGNPGYYGDHIAPKVLARNIANARIRDLVPFRDEIGRAATFSVIPQMVTEEYLQANARLHADGELRSTLARLHGDLQALAAAKAAPPAPRQMLRVSLQEMQMRNKCFPGSPAYYGPYVSRFVAQRNPAALALPMLTLLIQAVQRAAAPAGIAQSLDEAYLRDVTAYAATIRDKNQNLLSPWAARQNYQVLRPQPVAPIVRKTKPTPEEIARLQREAAARKAQKVAPVPSGNGDPT